MSRQVKWLDHELVFPKTNVTFLAFSHPRDNATTLSNNLGMGVTKLLKGDYFAHSTQPRQKEAI